MAIVLAVAQQSTVAQRPEQLAASLSAEKDHYGAAIEFRRLALEETDPAKQNAYYWDAAYEYWKARELDAMGRMLDRVRDDDIQFKGAKLLLKTEKSLSESRWDAAVSNASGIIEMELPQEMKRIASRKAAAAILRQGDIDSAKRILESQTIDTVAIRQYQDGPFKRPLIGGLLGLIPGFGHFYAGEYGTGARSLLLNGLFIAGMIETAENDDWGFFGCLTFFEITWYSGSVYGGIDACERFNQQRLDEAVNSINPSAGFAPDHAMLPLFTLKYSF